MRAHGNERRHSACCEELMINNRMEGRSRLRIRREDLLYKGLCLKRRRAIRRELILVVTNTPGIL